MKVVSKIIIVGYLIVACLTLNAQIPSFIVDTIYNPGTSIYRVSTGKSNDVWYTGGLDSNEVYEISYTNSFLDYSLLYQSNAPFVITDVYNTGVDSVLISTLGGGIYYLDNGNLIQLGVANGLSKTDYTSLVGPGEIMNPLLNSFFESQVYANSYRNYDISNDKGTNFTNISNFPVYDSINVMQIELGNPSNVGYFWERLSIEWGGSGGWDYETSDGSNAFSAPFIPDNFRPNSITSWKVNPFYKWKYFIATNNGFRVMRQNSFSLWGPPIDSLYFPNTRINKVLKYYPQSISSGYVLMGSDSGFYAMNKNDWQPTKINLGFECNVYDIAKEKDCVWLATDTGLVKLKNIDCAYSGNSIVFGDVQADVNDSCFIAISLSCSNCTESVLWNFGDSTTGSNFSENHYYSNSGSYNVTATVSNGYCAQVVTDSIFVELCCSPSYFPSVVLSQDSICLKDSIVVNSHQNNDFFFWNSDSSSFNYFIPDTSGTYTVVVTSDFGCKDTSSISVNFYPMINPNLPLDTGVCYGESILLSMDSILFSNVVWLDSIMNIVIQINDSGIYNLSYRDVYGCVYDDTIQVVNYNNNQVELGVDSRYCLEHKISLAGNYQSYLWFDNTVNDSILIDSSGIYWVEVMDSNYCVYKDTVTINIVIPLPINLGSDTTICENDILWLDSPNQNTMWSTGYVGDSIQVDTSGIYTAFYIDSLGCEMNGQINVTMQQLHSVNLDGDTDNCIGDNVLFNLNNTNATFLWHDNTTLSSYSSTSSETVRVTVTEGVCSVTDSISLVFSEKPVINVDTEWELCEDSSYTILLNDDNYQFLWSTGETSASIQVSSAGEYSVVITNVSCSVNQLFVLSDCSLGVSIPNTITPNGDSYNDFWIIENIEQFPDHIIQIFNRNGSLIFESNNYHNDWSGTYNGSDLPATTYYYIIDLGIGEGILKGDLSIIREQ